MNRPTQGKPVVLSHRTMPPGVPAQLVTRPRLNRTYADLYQRYHHVVVIAPAGAGKTVQAQLYAQDAGLPLAWLSLQRTDASPSRLLDSLAAALGDHAPAAYDQLRAAFQSDSTVEESASILAGAVGPERFLLVIDQCEEVLTSPEAASVLSTLAEYCPSSMLLMSLSRIELPDVVRHGVFEDTIGIVTEDDLRLTPDEATELVIANGGDGRRAADLVSETSGWMAGVVFASRRRALAGSSLDLGSYIRTEVLGQLPQDEQQFLLDSSVLDAVGPETAEAIRGRTGRELYERIRLRHLPATTMTETAMVYHSVLKTVLRAELVARDADREGQLLRRYAEYLVKQQHLEEATELFLDLGDLDRASQTARETLPILYARTDWDVVWRWLQALGDARVDHDPLFIGAKIRTLYGLRRFEMAIDLIRRLDQLGELRASTEADPGLVATMGWALQADPAESRRFLDRYPGDYRADAVRFMLDTETGLSAAVPPQTTGWGEFDRLVSWGLVLQGRFAEFNRMIPVPSSPVVNPNVVLGPLWRGQVAEARALWDRVPDGIRDRPHSLFIEGCLLLAEEDVESAASVLRLAISESRKTGFPLDPVYEVMYAFVLLVREEVDDAVTVLEKRLARLAEGGRLALTEWAQAFLGVAYLKAGAPKRAKLILQECIRSMQQAKRRLLLPLAACALSDAEAQEGDLDAAHDQALLAAHTASLTDGSYWLMWGARLFPEVRARELERDDSDERWRRVPLETLATPSLERASEPGTPITLYLQPFGTEPDILVDGEPKRLSRLKMLELVAFLSMHPKGVDRNVLQQQLFPKSDQRRGGNHFRQITHKLRAATGISLARLGESKVALPGNVALDTADLQFERLLHPSFPMTPLERVEALREAVAMSGTYLERSDLAWADERRYQLDVLREEALLELASLCLQQGDYEEVRARCEQLLELDPYNESSYGLLLRAEQQLGTPTSCLAVYRRAVKALQELGLSPSEQTTSLANEILGQTGSH